MDLEERNLAGCCGLFCGLCTRYQSTAPSRCLGCQLGEQHSYCSVYRCCQRHECFTCADCGEFPCERLLRVLGVELGLDSFVSHKPAIPNLERIREIGLEPYLMEQQGRRLVTEELLASYNDGRSMTFFCTAGALLESGAIREAISRARDLIDRETIDKERMKLVRKVLEDLASASGIDLKLRKKSGK